MNFTPPTPIEQKWLETGLYSVVSIVYGNLKSENSQDYAQKPQRNCTFMNSASGEKLDTSCYSGFRIQAYHIMKSF
jgi:hypothetical protein